MLPESIAGPHGLPVRNTFINFGTDEPALGVTQGDVDVQVHVCCNLLLIKHCWSSWSPGPKHIFGTDEPALGVCATDYVGYEPQGHRLGDEVVPAVKEAELAAEVSRQPMIGDTVNIVGGYVHRVTLMCKCMSAAICY